MLVLDGAAVRALFPMEAAIAEMRTALARYSAGEVVQPLRMVVRAPDRTNLLALMPAWTGPSAGAAGGREALGLKAVAIFPGNPAHGLDVHQGAVTMFDPETGVPTATLDAATVTEIRTAAVSGVATDALALPSAGDLAILGAGVQARSHLEAMATVRPLRRVRVWSRTATHAQAFADWAGTRFGQPVEVCATPAAALAGADLACTTLACVEPVVEAAMLAPGLHLNAVGACVPSARELTTDAVAAATVIVDSRESALGEAGDLLIPIHAGALDPSHIAAELGEVLLGRHPGRTLPEEITLFKSLGLAIEDVTAGAYIQHAARAQGLGTDAPLA